MENHKDWKERLDQNEAPMDTGKFWESLESKIPAAQANKKKRRFFFWLLVFLIGSGLTVGGVVLTKPEKEVKELATYESVKQEMETIEENRNSIIYSENDGTEVEKTAAAGLKPVKNARIAPINNARSDQNLQKKSRSTGRKRTVSIDQAASENPILTIQELQNENTRISEDQIESIVSQMSSNSRETSGIENQMTHISSAMTESMIYAKSLEYLPTLTTELSSELNWTPGSMPSFDNIQKINTKKSGWQYWMDLSYGVGMAQHSFSTSDPFIRSYLDSRSKHESNLESRLAVWENRLIHPSGLYVSTGLRYQSHITRFDWSKEETKLGWKLADGFFEDAEGNQVAMQDSAWQQYRELREIRQHNTISTLDIPLNIGYFMRKNRFSLEFAVGVTANIAQYSSGKQLNLQGEPVIWNDSDELSFKEFSTGWGASAMLRASWYPAEYLGIFIQPSFHKDFSNRMITDAGYSHKIDFIGVQAGLSFLLFGEGR